MKAELLNVKDLRIGFESPGLIEPVSFQVFAGDIWGIVGPNGAGKSTLLKTLLGFIPSLSGSFRFDGCHVGYIPQRGQLREVPIKVREVVSSGIDHGQSFLKFALGRKGRVENALNLTGTFELADRQFFELSEGQKQKVLIARAMAGESRLLILDEPTSAMDLNASRDVLDLLSLLTSEHGVGVLMVSHDVRSLLNYVNHVLFLDCQSRTAFPMKRSELEDNQAFMSWQSLV